MDELMRLLSYHEIFHGKQFLLFILDLYPTPGKLYSDRNYFS